MQHQTDFTVSLRVQEVTTAKNHSTGVVNTTWGITKCRLGVRQRAKQTRLLHFFCVGSEITHLSAVDGGQ